jgi:hypothetical protein
VLARPGLVGAACRPPRHLPDQAAPSSITSAASEAKAKVSHLHSIHSASRRTAVFTDSPFVTLQAEEHHRGHAQAEQVFADWTDGPLAHLPSGSFPANAAWLALAAISCNLLRAAGSLASPACAKARGATVRRDLINVAARTAHHGRGHLTLHLPEGWHREHEWMNLLEAACGPPAAAA